MNSKSKKVIKNVIVMINLDDPTKIETWGSLTEICRVHDFNYNTLKYFNWPFEFSGWGFHKVLFRQSIKSQTNEK